MDHRATRQRVILAVLEVATIVAWFFVRGKWSILTPASAAMALAGALLALTGAGLAVWAKVRLGRLFSTQLGIQVSHSLITTGPYGIVRHPIYLGLIDFIAGTALYLNDVGLLVVAVLFVVYFTMQLRIEERFFAEYFGRDWEEYRRRTAALVPGLVLRGKGKG